jgi:hypothetical protein
MHDTEKVEYMLKLFKSLIEDFELEMKYFQKILQKNYHECDKNS